MQSVLDLSPQEILLEEFKFRQLQDEIRESRTKGFPLASLISNYGKEKAIKNN